MCEREKVAKQLHEKNGHNQENHVMEIRIRNSSSDSESVSARKCIFAICPKH